MLLLTLIARRAAHVLVAAASTNMRSLLTHVLVTCAPRATAGLTNLHQHYVHYSDHNHPLTLEALDLTSKSIGVISPLRPLCLDLPDLTLWAYSEPPHMLWSVM